MTNELAKTARVPATLLSLEDVFTYPQYSLHGINTWDEIAKLGSNNIAALIKNARGNESGPTAQIGKLKEQQKLLEGKSGADFVEMAKEYENPKITDIGGREGNWAHELEPLDPASANRKRAATTFNMCGWCKHSGGGSGRYNYMITTYCSLLGGYDNVEESKFNTPCFLQKMGAEQIAPQVERIKLEVERHLAHREKVRQGIKLLQRLMKGQPQKPYLISLRPHDHFDVGDEAMAYIGQWNGDYKQLVQGKWVPVFVVFGYRHHDGCVSAQAEFPIHSNTSYDGGRGWSSGDSSPMTLLRKEYEWLRHAAEEGDLGFAGLWVANIDEHSKLDRAQFLTDLTGDIALPPADWQPPTDEIKVNTVEDAERVLQCLSSDLFKSEEQIRSWANMQLRYVHPDRLAERGDNVKAYAERQTRAVYAARDLLIARLPVQA